MMLLIAFKIPLMISTGQPGMFGKDDFEQLAPVVDGFSLMTYDFSSGPRWEHRHSWCNVQSPSDRLCIKDDVPGKCKTLGTLLVTVSMMSTSGDPRKFTFNDFCADLNIKQFPRLGINEILWPFLKMRNPSRLVFKSILFLLSFITVFWTCLIKLLLCEALK